MDPSRFDALSRAFVPRLGRRGLLAAVAGGLLVFGSARDEAGAAKSGKCKRGCGECETCKRGDCDKNRHGRKRCKKGKCKPKANGTPCAGGTCQSGACGAAACGSGGPCLAFLTSTRQNGNLGGLDGADALCQQRAAAAGLPGAYKAWLSDATESPATRFAQSPGPYQLVNGATVADSWADLVDGQLDAAINATELGAVVSTLEFAWTHTSADGTVGDPSTGHCDEWTNDDSGHPVHSQGHMGDTTAAHNAWTEAGGAGCSNDFRLYCFQQG